MGSSPQSAVDTSEYYKDHTETQYGMQTPNGGIVWQDEYNQWNGFHTPEMRQKKQEEFVLRLKGLGVDPATVPPLRFFVRQKTITHSAPELIDDRASEVLF